jgi:hypothetical protein
MAALGMDAIRKRLRHPLSAGGISSSRLAGMHTFPDAFALSGVQRLLPRVIARLLRNPRKSWPPNRGWTGVPPESGAASGAALALL